MQHVFFFKVKNRTFPNLHVCSAFGLSTFPSSKTLNPEEHEGQWCSLQHSCFTRPQLEERDKTFQEEITRRRALPLWREKSDCYLLSITSFSRQTGGLEAVEQERRAERWKLAMALSPCRPATVISWRWGGADGQSRHQDRLLVPAPNFHQFVPSSSPWLFVPATDFLKRQISPSCGNWMGFVKLKLFKGWLRCQVW